MVFPLILELYVLALGVSLLLASLFVFYRDLGHIWDILTQVIFYGSAIVYPISYVPARFILAFVANPLAQIVEDVRHAVVIADAPWTANVVSSVNGAHVGWFVLVPIGISLALFAAGLAVFTRLSPVFAEQL
jgi:ABC-2 type transport system permease protein